MGEIVDIHSDWASSDKVSEKPWWSFKSKRQQWLYSTQACAAIHDDMTSLAGKHRLVWFTWSIWWECTAASFSIQRVGSKCDETEKVVSEIQESFDSVSVRNATIKETSDGAHPEWVEAGIKVDKATVQIDPSILFLRCTALAQRDNENSTAYFAHGMTAVRTSLFRDFFLRKVDKSELGREIKKNMWNSMADYMQLHIVCLWLMAVRCCISREGKRILHMQTCLDSTVPFSGQRMDCAVWCLMGIGRAINQMSRTQSSSDWKCVSSNYCDSWKCTSS